jgi:ADP-ribosyl-[dinitrogen reductase] hydrolase
VLVEIAIADAYGAGFEYSPIRMVQTQNDLSGYRQHPTHRIKPGCYTDDTQMSLAIAELLVDGVVWTRENIVNKFLKVFHRDRRVGYAKGFYHLLLGSSNSTDFLEKIRPSSDKSGAAMRSCPIGILSSEQQIIEYSKMQAAITHNTDKGIGAAVGAALLSHYAIYHKGSKTNAHKYLHSFLPGLFRVPWRGKVGSQGLIAVSAALTAFQRNDRLSDLLKDCVAFGGDVDTVATIAMGAAANSQEYTHDLPDTLYQRLENGRFGGAYLERVSDQLLSLKT